MNLEMCWRCVKQEMLKKFDKCVKVQEITVAAAAPRWSSLHSQQRTAHSQAGKP